MKTEIKNNILNKTNYISTGDSFATKTIDFSRLSKKKLDEFTDLMKEHQMNCVKAGNFIEAELAKQRIVQLNKIKDRKKYSEALKRQEEEKDKFDDLKDKELQSYKLVFSNKYTEEITKLEDMLSELKKKHEDQLRLYFINFENNYPKEFKPSNELIEKQKQLEYYIKNEE